MSNSPSLRQIEVIENYLDTPQTDFALLIKGLWGSGKTYYFKHTLVRLIEDKNYKPVYVSMYGVNSIDDIARKIFLEINPLIKTVVRRKAIRRISELGKAVLGGVSVHGFKVKWPSLKADVWIDINKKYILCFDDMERSSLNIIEIFGYINNFMEHDSCKVIIIANEEEIHERDKVYIRYKEKLIGRTVDYEPDIDAVFKSMVDNFEPFKEYQLFLLENQLLVQDLLKRAGNYNLRILKHALIYFRNIFIVLRSLERKLSKADEIELFFFALTISYATKTGEDAPEISKELLGLTNTVEMIMLINTSSVPGPDQKVLDRYYDKYYKGTKQRILFSKAVSQYVINGFLDKELLAKEFREDVVGIEDPKKLLIQQVLSEWFMLSDTEFMKCTSELLNYIENGEINIRLYPRLFEYYEIFVDQQVVSYNIDTVLLKFTDGLAKACKKAKYSDLRHDSFLGADKPSEHLKVIRELAEKCLDSVKEQHFSDLANEAFSFYPAEAEKFAELLLEREGEDLLYNFPVFRVYNPESVFEKIKIAENKDLVNLHRLLNSRYLTIQGMAVPLTSEYENLRKLSSMLAEYHIGLKISLKKKLIKNLTETFDKCAQLLRGIRG